MSTYESIDSTGGLLPTSLLERVRAGDPSLEGTSPESYGLVPGERLNDHITRSWNRLRGVWEGYTSQLEQLPASDRGTTLTRSRWCRPLLDELGFDGLPVASGLEVDGKPYPISHVWGDQVPVHVMGARIQIDRRAAGVAGAATVSPHGLVQEFLNRSNDHLWGIVTNGFVLRVLRDNASLTKQAYVEFDLEAMFAGDLFSDFVVLWLTCHRTRFEGAPPEKCLLEQWSTEAAEAGTRALDKLRDGVESAITALGSGFVAHPANSELREGLRSGDLTTTAFQHQVLRVVYRLLFLLVAESRDLLHAPDTDPTSVERYRRFYSIDRLRTLAAQRRGSSHDDLWTGVMVTMNGLWHDGVPGLGLTPLGSSLWSPSSIRSLADARLDNRHFLDAIRALCFVRDDEARSDRAVDYKNLGAEELGSVYEALLELHAEVDVEARTFALTTAAGNERKTTGSYYTPTSLISELLNSALDPVLDQAGAKPDPEAALLNLKVIDPAAGSGHFLIAAAHRIAGRLASIRAGGGEPAPDELRHALRDVVSNCIHAIDVNPMAVELCKVSMWLEGTEPGKPLSFLDHRIVCGNALLGTTPALLATGVPDEAFAVLTGDDKETVASLKKRNKAARKGQGSLFGGGDHTTVVELAAGADEVAALGEDSIEDVEQKARRWSDLTTSTAFSEATFAADLWCAAFLAAKTPSDLEITQNVYLRAIEHATEVPPEIGDLVGSMAQTFRFFHWHLAFLDVFDLDGNGGFDVVIGNPPWEKVKISEREFFAARDPDIAEAPNSAERKRRIAALESSDPDLFKAFTSAKLRQERLAHFFSSSGLFPLMGQGEIDTYRLFAEAAARVLSPDRGLAGLVLPTGVIMDKPNQDFSRFMIEGRRLTSVLDFSNQSGSFPSVGGNKRFCLLTFGPFGKSELVTGASQLLSTSEIGIESRLFTLSVDQVLAVNPTSFSWVPFSSAEAARLIGGLYGRGDVDTVGGNSGSFEVSILLHMSTASDKFSMEAGPDLAPLYESKLFSQHNHRANTFEGVPVSDRGGTKPRTNRATLEKLCDPAYEAEPRYWISKDHSEDVSGRAWHVGYRNTVSAVADARSLISAVLPRGGIGNNASTLINNRGDHARELFVCGWLNTFIADFVLRNKLAGSNVNFFVMEQLPLPNVKAESPVQLPFVVKRVLELNATSWSMCGLLAEFGFEAPFMFNDARRAIIFAEIDAFMAHAVGITRQDMAFILEQFRIVRERDVELHGEYRTKRLILERYDAMAEAEASGAEYQTVLDPPPADPSIAHDPSTRPEWADWYLTGAQ